MKKKLVFLTGAGISAESGIPTFRDAVTGLWENASIEEVCVAGLLRMLIIFTSKQALPMSFIYMEN